MGVNHSDIVDLKVLHISKFRLAAEQLSDVEQH